VIQMLAAVSPLIGAGNVYLPHPQYSPWVNDFIEGCATLPNGAHDDQGDLFGSLGPNLQHLYNPPMVWKHSDSRIGCCKCHRYQYSTRWSRGRLLAAESSEDSMKLVKRSHACRFCLFSAMLTSGLAAQETPIANGNSDGIASSSLDVSTGTSVTVNPDCNGARFNLEPRANALPQNTESVDFLLNRVSSGVDLVVGAANDQRTSIGGFDAYYVHRQGSNCEVDFEGTLSSAAIDPTVVADPARDAFFLADQLLSLSQVVEVGRTTAANLLSSTACPGGTQLNGSNPNCWPVVGTADFTNPSIRQAALLDPHIAVDPRTSGTGAGDVYVVAQYENSTKVPAVASAQIIACKNLTLTCGSPVAVSGSDTFGSYPYVQVRPDGIVTISYWTYTQPFGAHPNPVEIKFVTCQPQGAPKAPLCSTPILVATTSTNVTGLFAPGDSGFHDFLFPKHANRLEADGTTFTAFLVYDRCHSIIGSPSVAAPVCSKVDVVFTFSTDDGATWSAPEAVESGAGHQFFGTIRNDTSTETINIAYYSTQEDLFLQRAKVRLRQIAPGTTTPGPANILTTASTDPDAGIQNLIEPDGEGVIDFGDRIGLAAVGTGSAGQSKVYVHYTWNDVFGTFSGTAQPDQNNTLLGLSY